MVYDAELTILKFARTTNDYYSNLNTQYQKQ